MAPELNADIMYTVLRCRKCGHKLYVEECLKGFAPKLGRIARMECPECGEEPEGNWIICGRESEYPVEEDGDDDDF